MAQARQDEFVHSFDLMAAQIVHDDNIPSVEGRNQGPLEEVQKPLAIDGAPAAPVTDGSIQTDRPRNAPALRCVERDMLHHTLFPDGTAIQPCYVDIDTAFIQKYKLVRIEMLGQPGPFLAFCNYIGDAPVLLRAASFSCG